MRYTFKIPRRLMLYCWSAGVSSSQRTCLLPKQAFWYHFISQLKKPLRVPHIFQPPRVTWPNCKSPNRLSIWTTFVAYLVHIRQVRTICPFYCCFVYSASWDIIIFVNFNYNRICVGFPNSKIWKFLPLHLCYIKGFSRMSRKVESKVFQLCFFSVLFSGYKKDKKLFGILLMLLYV
jgi:hypothetical protein